MMRTASAMASLLAAWTLVAVGGCRHGEDASVASSPPLEPRTEAARPPAIGEMIRLDDGQDESLGAAEPFDGAEFVRRLQKAVAAGPASDGKGHELARLAVDAAAALNVYSARFEKQECIGAVLRPVEQMEVWVRETPRAVRLRWVGAVDRGKDVLYVEGENGDRLRVYAGHLFLKLRLDLEPTSDAARKDNRHPITRMGLATLASGLLLNVGESVAAAAEEFHLLGRAALDGQTVDVVGRTAAADAPDLPSDLLIYCLDARTHLPALAARYDDGGNLLERYRYSAVTPLATAPDRVFDFASLGRKL